MITKWKKGIAHGRRKYEQARAVLFNEDWRLRTRFEDTRERYFNHYWNQVAEAVNAEIDSIGYGYFRLQRDGKTTFVKRGEVMLDDHLTLDIAGNKPLVHKLLKEQSFTVPEYLEYDLTSINKALRFMQERQGNFVVKPASGSAGGWGITTKINTATRLYNASYKASAYSSKLIIEHELPGANYRLLYLNGEFIDAIRRDSPGVTGNGISNLRELINKENQSRLNSDMPYALSPLTMDLDCLYTLEDRNESLKDIPPDGKRVEIKTATNQYSRYENHSVRDQIHPSIIDYGRKISKVINVTFSGVDVMINDCTRPLDESGCIVNEINTTPGLHHHAMISDTIKEVAVGPKIIDYIFRSMT